MILLYNTLSTSLYTSLCNFVLCLDFHCVVIFDGIGEQIPYYRKVYCKIHFIKMCTFLNFRFPLYLFPATFIRKSMLVKIRRYENGT